MLPDWTYFCGPTARDGGCAEDGNCLVAGEEASRCAERNR